VLPDAKCWTLYFQAVGERYKFLLLEETIERTSGGISQMPRNITININFINSWFPTLATIRVTLNSSKQILSLFFERSILRGNPF